MLYLSNPAGVSREVRRAMIERLKLMNEAVLARGGDPETRARISQYEMAFRMQTSVPELTDLSDEPKHILDLYGPDVHKPGTFAASCLLARRMAERDVRFVQVFIRGWDQHGNLPGDIRLQTRDVDQASAALVKDLKQRGMLDETLVIWGGEFGRTNYCQGKLTTSDYGRDHHPRCFSMWMAGGGIKGGVSVGKTDELGSAAIEDSLHVRNLHATILQQMGMDPNRLTYFYGGLDQKLVGVEGAEPIHQII